MLLSRVSAGFNKLDLRLFKTIMNSIKDPFHIHTDQRSMKESWQAFAGGLLRRLYIFLAQGTTHVEHITKFRPSI